MHDYHENLAGYSAAQIWHDGCGECETRAKRHDYGIDTLDQVRFVAAWERAARWHRDGLPDLAKAEMPLLNVLWSIQLKLDIRGLPIGECPDGHVYWRDRLRCSIPSGLPVMASGFTHP